MRYVLGLVSKPFTVGVIGGGITGLVTAWRLSRHAKCTRVTLYEKSPRLGGFIQSETIPVDGGNVVFEYGARSIRVSESFAYILAEMMHELGIDRNMLRKEQFTNAEEAYIYYPDRLLRVPYSKLKDPHTLLSMAQEPVFRDGLLSALCEPFRRQPSIYPDDESVGQFISRRFSKSVADNLVSAMFHGIYAGDINKLSAKALVGQMREREFSHGSIGKSLLRSYREKNSELHEAAAWMASNQTLGNFSKESRLNLEIAKAITWKNGLVELVDALVAALKASRKVEIITNADVNGISQVKSTSDMTVNYGRGRSRVHNKVIATTPAPEVARMLGNSRDKLPQNSITSLSTLDYAVSVMVVNLYYSQPNLVPVRGFGYLIPQSIPPEQNPEGALGVIFSSETSVHQDTAPGTKLTVMLGGHLWDHMKESGYPDHDQGVAMARSLLERHLGIKEAPTLARSRLQRNGIPQYTVGHMGRLKAISQYVQHDFDHRLTLAGNWYGGVSIPNCIEQAYLAASVGIGDCQMEVDGIIPMEISRVPAEDETAGGICILPERWRWMPQRS